MNKNNCPNCGAPINAEKNKCEYCGTSYFDLSAIDIDGGEPFYLKLRRRNPNGGYDVITAFVRANPSLSISSEQDTLYCDCGYRGYIPFQVPAQYELEMSFHTVNRHFDNEPHSLIIEYIRD